MFPSSHHLLIGLSLSGPFLWESIEVSVVSPPYLVSTSTVLIGHYYQDTPWYVSSLRSLHHQM